MAIIQFHTPQGIIEVDTDTVTDAELASLYITREAMMEVIPRDLQAEIDELKKVTADHEARLSKDIGGHIR